MENRISVKRHGFLGPITALCWNISGNLVLCGRGSSILALNTSRRILASLELFESSRIHGIKMADTRPQERADTRDPRRPLQGHIVVAHGDKNVVFAELSIGGPECAPQFSFLGNLLDLDDWILDVQLIRDEESISRVNQRANPSGNGWSRVAIGFAHNIVQIWRWASKERIQVKYNTSITDNHSSGCAFKSSRFL